MRQLATLFTTGLATALILAACGTTAEEQPTELTLVTHDSFAISDETLAAFTAETGVTVTILTSQDAGFLVNQAILTKDNPTADVLYGVDNTFLSRALEAELFVEYTSPMLEAVPDTLELDSHVTPISFGDVCLNYDKAAFGSAAAPGSLDDLIDPAYAGQLVVQHPATSSPGLAFLMATIATYGEDGWQDYWRALVANDIEIAPDWTAAYYGSFTGGGGADRPIVVSYASSPPAGVIFSEVPLDEAPTATVTEGCFRQIEFAGILKDSVPARALVDFMLSTTFQEDIPMNMFVFPANENAALPQEFIDHTEIPTNPATLDPATIDANREKWIEEWTQIVLN